MKQSPELEAMLAGDDARVADKNTKRNQLVGGAALLLAGAAAAYLVLMPSAPQERDMIDGQDEEFRTTTFRPPTFLRDGEEQPEEPPTDIVQLPPPPPPPEEEVDTVRFNVPPPPDVIIAEPGEQGPPAQVIVEEPPVEEFPARYRSGLITMDQSGGAVGQGSLFGDGEGGGPTVAGDDRSSQFLGAVATVQDRKATARKIERIDALVPEGTLIPGILETAIVSDLPGQIRAITSQDVYSFDGRRVLIPTGTRLIGEYQSGAVRGQKRVFVVWTRLIRDDGVSVRLNSIGTDSLGRSGLTGLVDNKWRERFGSAILLSVVGAGASYLTGYGSDQAFGRNNTDAQRGEELARETIAKTFSDMANQALGENLRIQPTISVRQGERIFIFVRQDLDFSAMYEDPVTEAMREIQRERRGH